MTYEALIVPHESPPTLREIKRALLTYDKAVLVDPGDRELMPRNAYMAAVMGMPIFGMDTGPVRPMGKMLGYDERFERTFESLAEARSQNLLELRATYEQQAATHATIGAVPTGGYPLNFNFVFWAYRAMAESQDFLNSALEGNVEKLSAELRGSSGLALTGQADFQINDSLPLPNADILKALAESNATALSQVARARIGSMIKYAGYCEQKNLVPLFDSSIYGKLISTLLNRTEKFVAAADDGASLRRTRVLELVHEEFMVDERLDALSVAEVIKLRTRAWGTQAEAREKLFQSIFQIANDATNSDDFDKHANKSIADYRRNSESVVRERATLGLSIKCNLGITALGGGVALTGLLTQMESPLASVGLTLAAGGIWMLEKAKEYVPHLREIQAQERELRTGAGFGLHNFYTRLSK